MQFAQQRDDDCVIDLSDIKQYQNPTEIHKLNEWLQSNDITHRWTCTAGDLGRLRRCLHFTGKKDAMMFKLVFGGAR